MLENIVPDGVRAIPLARYLSRAYPMVPGWVIRDALKNKDARVNGVKTQGASVSAGDEIKAYIPDKYLDFSLNVLYYANGLLVVDKPSGLPVDADADGIGADTLLTRAARIDKNAKLCHRLDAGTGGVVILATDETAYERVLSQFREHKAKKTYECVIKGKMDSPDGVLTDYLVKDASNSFVRVVSPKSREGEKAELAYTTVEENGSTSLVRVRLITGRTHQIRVQFANARHPLIGDDKYGDREANKKYNAQRPMLWCREIALGDNLFTSLGGLKCI